MKTQSLTAGSARENTPAFRVAIYQTYRDNDRVIMELKNLRKEAKTLLLDRPHVTLKSDNFQAWKSNILSGADLIEAKYILEEEQTSVPEDCDELGESLWKEKRRFHIRESQHHCTTRWLTVSKQNAQSPFGKH